MLFSPHRLDQPYQPFVKKLNCLIMVSFLEGIPPTQLEWDARDSRLPVSVPADDDTLLFI